MRRLRLSLAALALLACGSAGATPTTATTATPGAATSSAPAPTISAACHLRQDARQRWMPDPNCTPGATNPDVTPDPAVLGRTICRRGWTATVRPDRQESADLKREVLRRYGIPAGNGSGYEMDHRVPLEVGGAARDLANLWPEPWEPDSQHPAGLAQPGTGAQSKDQLEDRTRAAICGGRLTLQDGQRAFLGDWWGA